MLPIYQRLRMDPLTLTCVTAMAAGPSDGVWAPGRRALTLGLVVTITLVGFEALAVATAMPAVEEDLGGEPFRVITAEVLAVHAIELVGNGAELVGGRPADRAHELFEVEPRAEEIAGQRVEHRIRVHLVLLGGEVAGVSELDVGPGVGGGDRAAGLEAGIGGAENRVLHRRLTGQPADVLAAGDRAAVVEEGDARDRRVVAADHARSVVGGHRRLHAMPSLLVRDDQLAQGELLGIARRGERERREERDDRCGLHAQGPP